MSETQRKLSGILRKCADGLDSGNTHLEEEQMEYLLEAARYVTEEKLSKYQAAQFLNMNTKRFDYKVSKGEIPKGRKQVGFKEIFWYQKDLENIPKDK